MHKDVAPRATAPLGRTAPPQILLAVVAACLPACTWGIYDPSDAGSPSGEYDGGWFTVVQTSGTPHRISSFSGLASTNSTTLFWAQSSGQIEECTVTTPSLQGGPVSCSDAPQTFATSNGPDHMIGIGTNVDSDVLYWADDPGTGDGNLDFCDVEGVSPCSEDAGSIVLRAGGAEVSPRLFGSDTMNLYWVENDQTGASFFQCPLPCTTSPSSPVATSTGTVAVWTILHVSVGSLPVGAFVWATTTQELWSCVPTASGCPAAMIGTLGFAALGISGGDSQTPPLVTGNGAVNQLECTGASCSATALFQVPSETTMFLNSDSSNIYVATVGGAIYAAARNSAFALTLLASGQGQIGGWVVAGKYLYWTSSSGIVGGVAR